MIDTNKLNAAIAAKGLNKRKVAHMLGISETSMYQKMKKGIFGSNEIMQLIQLLDISECEIPKIFFVENTPDKCINGKES